MAVGGREERTAVAGAVLVAAVGVLSLCHPTSARQALKGDPGLLGDSGLDLSRYAPSTQAKSRAKRYFLSFPSSSTLTFNNRIKVPLFKKFDDNISGVFKGYIRVEYKLPSDLVTLGRSAIDEDRFHTYSSIESVFSKLGVNGHQCLLKAICETAEEPAEDYGLVGQLVDLILSPNHGAQTAKEALREYTAAENYGREVGNCGLAYSACPLHLPELLTTGLSVLQGSMAGPQVF
ncbi:uncharacterized protein LOC127009663 [Eriocheir sinensis]|uniref:uncharacterized protein LOC127009663 n=1 Tax=Eriocheir sinensis TaxID=95602 RepID=UPI0021C65575|nr:uncharacterized protein LOC127009663 [Eriocheir sinensis]